MNTVSCESLRRKQACSWEDKRIIILDSLSKCVSLQDSILCLNGFAYRDALYGHNNLNVSHSFSDSEQHRFDAETWYSHFTNDSLTVYCGGSGNFNAALFREFMPKRVIAHGFSIGMHLESQEGHYINLLFVPDSVNDKLFLVDPMFNSAFVDTHGDLIDLRTMIYLARKSLTELYTIKPRIESGQYIQELQETLPEHPMYDVRYPHEILLSNNNEFKYIVSCPRTLDHYLDAKFSETYVRIAQFHGYSLNFMDTSDFNYCVLFIRNIYGPHSNEIKRVVHYLQNASLSDLDMIFQTPE